MAQPLWRTVWQFLKTQKTEAPHDPAIPLLGLYLEKNMICMPNIHCSAVYSSQDEEAT